MTNAWTGLCTFIYNTHLKDHLYKFATEEGGAFIVSALVLAKTTAAEVKVELKSKRQALLKHRESFSIAGMKFLCEVLGIGSNKRSRKETNIKVANKKKKVV